LRAIVFFFLVPHREKLGTIYLHASGFNRDFRWLVLARLQ